MGEQMNIDQITEGYLCALQWADCEEGTNPRISNQARKAARAECELFTTHCGILADRAIELIGAHRFGFLFRLNSGGHGSGFWDEKALEEPSSDTSIMGINREGKAYKPGTGSLGKQLSDIAYGGSHISRHCFKEAEQSRGWVYIMGVTNV